MSQHSMEDGEESAPSYTVPARRLGALEHPLIVKDVDKAIKTLGENYALQAILDSASPQISVPLYMRHDNPTVRPLTSHNALTHNVVVKITVPKRTGRKRKRGSQGLFEGEIAPPHDIESEQVLSRSRLDDPKALRRKLCDNVDKYTVEPIGVITNTHRYRGLADFQYALGGSKFMSSFVDKVLPGDVAKLKEFALQPGIETGSNIELVPPPSFTPMALPFGYNYAQNPYTKEVSPGASSPSGSVSEGEEYGRVVNVTSRIPAAGYFIAHDEYPVPAGPRREPDMSDPQVAAIMTEMWLAMDERPIWTRRSMWNRLGSKFASLPKSGSLVRHCLQYAGYQFKGGPWRDALVRYGLDPRSDPKYRIYQTLIFKLHKTRIGSVGRSWQAIRRNEVGVTNFGKYWQEIGDDEGTRETHLFTGESFSTDGKVWQVCDITDPLLAQLFDNAEVRTDVDLEVSGFYHRVLWSVAKAIMKCKMLAIRFGRTLTDDDFGATLDAVKGPNDGGDGAQGGSIGITLPDLQLTAAECEQIRGQKMRPGLKPGRDRWQEKKKRTHYRVRIPLKETEEREAEKMIRLLSLSKSRGRAATRPDADEAGSGAAGLVSRADMDMDGGVADEEGREEIGDFGSGREDGEGDEGAAKSFQELLFGEEDSEDDFIGGEDDEEEDEEPNGGLNTTGKSRGVFAEGDDGMLDDDEIEGEYTDEDEEEEDELDLGNDDDDDDDILESEEGSEGQSGEDTDESIGDEEAIDDDEDAEGFEEDDDVDADADADADTDVAMGSL
ncbi:RNA polymerase III transcription factor IIIC subunit-domain-containing protein [Podospora appendiculata]|uniref:RNA polymerase III transcription factor IIIC subunit-domain-containing protein n=1 Tax=Podospora appendiculata TaxID=314037 RepID=A0AAE1CAK5_9PEZI|nr:RNA polymerase III transcription factor IIIC subunit-domain-containing protein [Podospora appendiculata]